MEAAKFKSGDRVQMASGEAGVVHRPVAANPHMTCRDCGGNNVKIGAVTFRYWVVPDGKSEDEAVKANESELSAA